VNIEPRAPERTAASDTLDLFSSEWLPNTRPLRVLDLFAGTGSSTAAFAARGHSVVTVELDRSHAGITHYADVRKLTPATVLDLFDGAAPDFIWASPPCQAFSVLRIGKNWIQGGNCPMPRTDEAATAIEIVRATLALIRDLEPRYWLMENPRAMLRKLAEMRRLPRRTVTYCQYGDTRQKPTDLFGFMPATWAPRRPCRPRAACHEAAPRGSRTGTVGLSSAKERSRIPHELTAEICTALEGLAL